MTDQEYTFNWHKLDDADDHEEFLSWMVVNLLSEHRVGDVVDPALDHLLNRVGDASDQFRNVKLTIQLNDVEVNAEHFVRCLHGAYRHAARKEAWDLLQGSTKAAELRDTVDAFHDAVREHAYRLADSLGITLNEDGVVA